MPRPAQSIETEILKLRAELEQLPPDARSSTFDFWRHRTMTILEEAVGASDALVIKFGHLLWTPMSLGGHEPFAPAFERAREHARGVLKSALWRVERAAASSLPFDEHAVDPDL